MITKRYAFTLNEKNGTFQIQLRARFRHIKNEKQLRELLEKSFIDKPYYQAMKTLHYEKNDILYILRSYGFLADSRRI